MKVHETLENRLVHAFWQEVVLEEIVPVVPPVPGQDLEAYAREIKDRFSNPQIKDTIRRLCFDSSNRVPKFVHPSIEDRLAEGKSVGGLALVSAFWCQYSYQILPKMDRTMDPRWEELTVGILLFIFNFIILIFMF
jgi:mannitol 2-dehydrogenase